MGHFYEGDRVRLGALRGGIVVAVNGKLRARFPDSDRLLWLDYLVPDEGPGGRINAHSWASCHGCGNPSVAFFCVNCEQHAQRQIESFHRRETAREHRDAIDRGEPSFGVHIAGPIQQIDRVVEQRCARCAVVISRSIGGLPVPMRWFPDSSLFPEGALIERGYLGIGRPRGRVTAPTCEQVVAPAGVRRRA